MGFRDIFPPVETALDLEPDELAPFILRDLATRGQGSINRYNYTLGTSQDLQEYAKEHREAFLPCLMEAWIWLEREMFLAPRPGTQGDWMFITKRGMRVLENADFKAYRQGVLLASESLDAIIAKDVKPLFLRGDFDTAVFRALKEVEIRVRKKAGLAEEDIGVQLIRKAFKPHTGPLTNTELPTGEQQAIADLFAGAVGTYKNPSSHKEIQFQDPHEVADIIRFANQLLRIVDRL